MREPANQRFPIVFSEESLEGVNTLVGVHHDLSTLLIGLVDDAEQVGSPAPGEVRNLVDLFQEQPGYQAGSDGFANLPPSHDRLRGIYVALIAVTIGDLQFPFAVVVELLLEI